MIVSVAIFASPLVVDIKKIAGNTKLVVEEYLGKHVNCTKVKYGEKCAYKLGETEIVYIKGLADWITVEGIDEVPFNKTALSSLGLKPRTPEFKSSDVIRWTNVPGIPEISIFGYGKNSDYAYIKIKTK